MFYVRDIYKGKISRQPTKVYFDFYDLTSFNQNILFALSRQETLVVQMANFASGRDTYLDHLETGVILNSSTALGNVSLYLATLSGSEGFDNRKGHTPMKVGIRRRLKSPVEISL